MEGQSLRNGVLSREAPSDDLTFALVKIEFQTQGVFMIAKLFGILSHDVGIDLGTANTLVYVRSRGIVLNEPSVVAINQKTKQVLAIGEEARQMVGRTPSHIVAIRPLSDGVISDFEITEQMLKYFISKTQSGRFSISPRPRVVVCVPYGVTEVERRAVEEAALSAGAREVFLIEEPLAAAIGAKLPVQETTGSMIVDIGGGTTEVAVMALGGVVTSRSLRIAGDEMNEDIVDFARDQFNLDLGLKTAEEIKISIGSAIDLGANTTCSMRGRDLVSGLPKEIIVDDESIRKAISKSVKAIIKVVKSTIEEAPAELVADIIDQGIVLSGGGALLKGLDKILMMETQTKVYIADDPLTCVVRGTGVVIEDIDQLRDVLLTSSLKG